jgi:hypothetical protein
VSKGTSRQSQNRPGGEILDDAFVLDHVAEDMLDNPVDRRWTVEFGMCRRRDP